jgi:predicted lipid-binding transport protein (Tim44 family)
MEDLLVLIIKLIIRAINSRMEKPQAAPTPAKGARAVAVAPPAPARKPPAPRRSPAKPTAVAAPTVMRKANPASKVVVAPARREADRSAASMLGTRRELMDAMVLTELLGAPAALRRNGWGHAEAGGV